MFKLGITGGIGSGKSTAASLFKSKGAELFDADEKAKNILINSPSIQEKTIQVFGNNVTTHNSLDLKKFKYGHQINRKKLSVE